MSRLARLRDRALRGFVALEPARFIRFALIGVVNTGIHFIVLVSLVERLAWWPAPANALAFLCANLFSFVANSRITFRAVPSWQRYRRFFAVSLFGVGFSWLMGMLAQWLAVHYLLMFALQLALMPLINYLLIRRFAFGR